MIGLAWSRSLPAGVGGLSLARESRQLLLWADDGTLTRLDRDGQHLVAHRLPYPLARAAFADDGRSVLTAGTAGQIGRHTMDLVPVWEKKLPRRPVAVALDHLGQRAAVADDGGGLLVLDDRGRRCWQATTPRPLVHLAFVPEAPVLLGAAEYGLVCAFDAAGSVLWRDGLVAHVGELAVTGVGDRAILACFTQGLCCYHPHTGARSALAQASPARLAAVSYRGDRLVTVGLEAQLVLRRTDGEPVESYTLPARPSAVALDALGGWLVALLLDGRLAALDLAEAWPRGVDRR